MQMIKNEPHWERGDFQVLINSLSTDDAKKRHDIRYALFRVKNQLDGEAPAEKNHWTIAEGIQEMKASGSLETFADVWDIGKVNPDVLIVKRLWSVEQEHDQLMYRISVPIEKADTPQSLAIKAEALEKREKRRFKKEQKRKK